MRHLATTLAFAARATLVACVIVVLAPRANAQTVSPDFAECSITAQGALACVPTTGGTCTQGSHGQYFNSQFCYQSSEFNEAKCDRDSNGRAGCVRWSGSSVTCYAENGIAKCYSANQNGSITPSPTLLSFSTQTVNAVSSTRNVTFTAGAVGYTINGFAITGDFQIASTTGSCTTAAPGSACMVSVTATPRLPGARSGTLSIVTSAGTVPVSLTVTGNGLPSPSGTDKDAGLRRTLRALTVPNWRRRPLAVPIGARTNDIGRDVFPQGSLFAADPVNMGGGNKVASQTDIDGQYAGPLTFTRTYNSYGYSSAGLVQQDIGVGWRSNWDSLILCHFRLRRERTGDQQPACRWRGWRYVLLQLVDYDDLHR